MKDSICWFCKNARGGCSWMQTHTPVSGWKASKTNLGYLVEQCPKYIQSWADITVDQISKDMGISVRTLYRKGKFGIVTNFYAAKNRKVLYDEECHKFYEWY